MAEATPRRRWNAVAAAAIALSLVWATTCAAALWLDRASFQEVASAMGPLVGAWTAMLIRMVGSPE